MKRFIYISIFPILILLSCSSDHKKTEGENESIVSEKFPIEYVKKYSIPRATNTDFGTYEIWNLNLINTTFFKKWFDNIKVNLSNDHFIRFDAYSRYYFYDYKEMETLFLFTIIHGDETYYNNFYHFTFDKEKGEILRVDYIASTGGDGGHFNVDKFHYNQTGDILIITSISKYDEDFETGYTREYDSLVTQVEFKQEETLFFRIDSTSRFDSIFDVDR